MIFKKKGGKRDSAELSCSAEVKPLKERLDGPVRVSMLMKLLGEACGSETYLRDFASQTQGKKLMVKFVPRQVDRGELEPLWPSLSRFRRYFGLIESVSSFSVLGQSTTSETDSISWYRKPCLYQCILPGFLLFLITVFLSTEKRSCILTWNFCPSYVCFHSMPTGVRVSKA